MESRDKLNDIYILGIYCERLIELVGDTACDATSEHRTQLYSPTHCQKDSNPRCKSISLRRGGNLALLIN